MKYQLVTTLTSKIYVGPFERGVVGKTEAAQTVMIRIAARTRALGSAEAHRQCLQTRGFRL